MTPHAADPTQLKTPDTATVKPPLKVLHIITGLDVGGAEIMLQKLIQTTPRDILKPAVISLKTMGPVGKSLQTLGIDVHALHLHRGLSRLTGCIHLWKMIRQTQPDVVQTWMYHGDLIGGVIARMATRAPIIWNVRHSDLSAGHYKQSTRRLARWCARLSRRLPNQIICCSQASLETHRALGYAAEKMRVLPNGFDCERFRPDLAARTGVRQELGLAPETRLIGYVARWHPQKDHASFLQAAAVLRKRNPGIQFILCGEGVHPGQAQLIQTLDTLRIADCVHLLGPREDIPRITASLDIAVSAAAFGEGFPNIIGEAMACAVPCVVTHVGDSARIVADCGVVVPPGDPAALAEALHSWVSLPDEKRASLGKQSRERILENFAIDHIARQYNRLYQQIAEQEKTVK